MFEKVNPGHPDKMADRLAGAVVDLVYERAGGLTFELSRQTGSGVSLRAKTTTNFASKREQCQTCLSIAEREQSQDRDSGINYTN